MEGTAESTQFAYVFYVCTEIYQKQWQIMRSDRFPRYNLSEEERNPFILYTGQKNVAKENADVIIFLPRHWLQYLYSYGIVHLHSYLDELPIPCRIKYPPAIDMFYFRICRKKWIVSWILRSGVLHSEISTKLPILIFR